MRLLRVIAFIAILVGAIGSFAMMLRIGHNQKSLFLIALFTGWDMSPFLALLLAAMMSKDWPVARRVALYSVMLVVTAGSLVVYGIVVYGPPRPQPAASFLVVPFVSWLLMAVVAGIMASRASAT